MIKARIIAGFLIAPVMPGLLVALYCLIASYVSSENLGGAWNWASLMFMIGVIFGYITALLFGVPLYVVLEKFHKKSLSTYMIAGLMLGFVAICIYFFAECMKDCSNTLGLMTAQTYLIIASMISGLVATIFFWFIARPDLVSQVKKA